MTESNLHPFPHTGGDGIPPHFTPEHLSELAATAGRTPLVWTHTINTAYVSEHRAPTIGGDMVLRGERIVSSFDRAWTVRGPGVPVHAVSGLSSGKHDAGYHADRAFFLRRAGVLSTPRCTHGADCTVHPGTGRPHNYDPTAREVLEELAVWAKQYNHPATAERVAVILADLEAR
jgi:hypothetical protein